MAATLSPSAVADEAKKPEPAAVTERGQSELQTTPATGQSKDVSILKQINKVNDDGSYTFGYEASDGSFKVETRDVAGNVKGMFGFVDEAGRLKRVSYSASNSSGFQATAGSTSPPLGADATEPSQPSSVQAVQPRKQEDDGDGEPAGGKSTPGGVKKVLVSKRPVMTVMAQEVADRRRGGNDLRRQLPRNDENDAPDVYGVHDRSSLQSGSVSPVVSALMSELDPVRSYRPTTRAPRPQDTYSMATTAYETQEDSISRQAQEDDEPATPQYRAVPARYRQPIAAYQQSVYPLLTPVAFQQQPVAPAYPTAYGPNLVALRDELMELILSFVQTRVSQLMSVAAYRHQPQLPPIQAYPMPYQQPNYYVPSYYQGPRVSGSAVQQSGGQQQDSYVAAAAAAQQQSSPRVTQTLKDGLIRMLLSTSPRYDPERIAGERAPRLTYPRQTTQPTTPVRSVQIIGEDSSDSRPVTTETPD